MDPAMDQHPRQTRRLHLLRPLDRGPEHYARACLSFSAFFLHPSVGERIGFGSTMILAQFVLMTVAGDELPTCGELLWIDVLLCLNMIFTFVALLESCYVTYISTMPPTLMECTEAKQKAEKVDSIARRTIPSIFFLLLCFAYNMESVEDAYAIDPCRSERRLPRHHWREGARQGRPQVPAPHSCRLQRLGSCVDHVGRWTSRPTCAAGVVARRQQAALRG